MLLLLGEKEGYPGNGMDEEGRAPILETRGGEPSRFEAEGAGGHTGRGLQWPAEVAGRPKAEG